MSRWRETYFWLGVAGPARRLVVVVDRHLAEPAREGDGELAARVDLAEHHVGDRWARLHAREPRLEDRGRVVDHVLQGERAAVEQHHRNRLPGRLDRPEQLLLPAREVEGAARRRLAAHLPCLAQGEHDLVRRLGDGHRLGESGVGAASLGVGGRRLGVGELAALGIGRARALLLDAVEDGHRVGVAARAPPGTEHVVLVVGQRPDHRRLLGRDPAAGPHPCSGAAPSSGPRPCGRPPPRRASASRPRPCRARRAHTGARTGRRGT